MHEAIHKVSCLLCLGLLSMMACDEGSAVDEDPWPTPQRQQARIIEPVDWEELWQVGGTLQDTLLQMPLFIRATEDGVLVADAGSHRILSFDGAGDLRWAFGRKGGGPDEFGEVRDIQVADGWTYVLDTGNARITVIDAEGGVEQRIRLQVLDSQPFQVVPVPGRILVVTASREHPVLVLNPDGSAARPVSLPWEAFTRLNILLRQGTVSVDGDSWVYALSLGNAWFRFTGERADGEPGFFVETVPKPRLAVHSTAERTSRTFVERPPCTACSTSIHGGRLYVHYGGNSDQNGRIIDAYDVASGQYLGSIELPRRVSAAQVRGNRVYVRVTNPYPAVKAYRIASEVPFMTRPGPSEGAAPERRRRKVSW